MTIIYEAMKKSAEKRARKAKVMRHVRLLLKGLPMVVLFAAWYMVLDVFFGNDRATIPAAICLIVGSVGTWYVLRRSVQ